MTNTYTLEEITGISAALGQLDGVYKETKDGQYALVPFKFDDSTRWNIAKNRRLLKAEIELYSEARDAIIKELSPINHDLTKETAKERESFAARNKELLKNSVELPGLLKLKKSSLLKDDGNPIAGSVLELLIPIVDETT